jgi:hypothetical protein
MTVLDVVNLAQERCAIGGMNITTCMNYIIDCIRMTVMDHPHTAGLRTQETFTLDLSERPVKYTTALDIAVINEIYLGGDRFKRRLREDEYFVDGDSDILFSRHIERHPGPYTIVYRAFPDTSDMSEGTTIPLPKQFQEALVWYVTWQYYSREMTPTDANATDYGNQYNNYCNQAAEHSLRRNGRRRMPARMV